MDSLQGLFNGLALYKVKVFSIGLLLGVVIDVALYLLTDGQIAPAVLLIIPIVTGILALIYDKWVIVASTAFGGAALAVGGIAYFVFGGVGPAMALMTGGHGQALSQRWLFWVAPLVGAAIAGLLYKVYAAPVAK